MKQAAFLILALALLLPIGTHADSYDDRASGYFDEYTRGYERVQSSYQANLLNAKDASDYSRFQSDFQKDIQRLIMTYIENLLSLVRDMEADEMRAMAEADAAADVAEAEAVEDEDGDGYEFSLRARYQTIAAAEDQTFIEFNVRPEEGEVDADSIEADVTFQNTLGGVPVRYSLEVDGSSGATIQADDEAVLALVIEEALQPGSYTYIIEDIDIEKKEGGTLYSTLMFPLSGSFIVSGSSSVDDTGIYANKGQCRKVIASDWNAEKKILAAELAEKNKEIHEVFKEAQTHARTLAGEERRVAERAALAERSEKRKQATQEYKSAVDELAATYKAKIDACDRYR